MAKIQWECIFGKHKYNKTGMKENGDIKFKCVRCGKEKYMDYYTLFHKKDKSQ